MAEEYLLSGDPRYRLALEDFPRFLSEISDGARGAGLPPGRVPYSTFWLAAGRRLIGSSRLRHRLTPDLEDEGGHVGYDIRPSERRKGYGTLILRRTLEEARGLGIGRVLLTCDADNVASAKVIEKNGGRLRDQAVSKRSGELISRYWIEL
ncbi:MAG: GNAT family N-acetyltransferase [Acidobacteriota bacterium]|nr:GNAT family N-acetyltransferase [Acidobacteriota bacterium]